MHKMCNDLLYTLQFVDQRDAEIQKKNIKSLNKM